MSVSPKSPAIAVDRIGQIAIVARDVAASSAFYRDVLGLRHLFDAGPQLAFFSCGGVRIMITVAEPEHRNASSILYFPVADLERAHAALQQAGARIEQPPHLIARLPDHELWMCFFRDPADNLLALMCEKR